MWIRLPACGWLESTVSSESRILEVQGASKTNTALQKCRDVWNFWIFSPITMFLNLFTEREFSLGGRSFDGGNTLFSFFSSLEPVARTCSRTWSFRLAPPRLGERFTTNLNSKIGDDRPSVTAVLGELQGFFYAPPGAKSQLRHTAKS